MAEIIKMLNNSNDFIEAVNNLSIKDLEKCIEYSTDKYYYTSTPIIDDNKYDILIDFLTIKNSKSKILKNIGSKIKSKDKVNLDYWLGSMNKIKENDELQIWLSKYNLPYNISDKLDGISALLIYTFNENIKLYTRGTGDEGLDISNLIKYLNLPSYSLIKEYCNENKLKGKKNLIAFRGELIIESAKFLNNWSSIFKNARNTIGGLVNSKKINPELAYDTNLVLYEVVDPFLDINSQFKIINDLKFKIVYNKNINKNINYEILLEYLHERINKSIYQIDGIIISNINNHSRNKKGNPDYAFAFKPSFGSKTAITNIIDIEWNISKNGNIIPTIIIDPINLGGVEIKRTSGFNAKYIYDNLLGPGSVIELIRSGDVIPYIKNIIKHSKEAKMPNNIQWYWDDFDIKILDKNNNNLLIKNIYYFFSTLETKGLGEKIIQKLVNNDINTIKKIFNIKKEDLLNISGIKEKSASNIINSINKTINTNIPLYKLMTASNKLGEGIGHEKIKLILKKYPNLLNDYLNWSKEEFIDKLIEIKGWDSKTSNLFVNNFKYFIKFYNEIKDYIKLIIYEENNSSEIKKLNNKKIVLSGFRDKKLQELINKEGGIITNTISSKTDYLIIKENYISEKIKKAKELGIKILTINEFNNLII
jgi:NAD-dependent DNA ligase